MGFLTGTSITFTRTLVLRSPITRSQRSNARNKITKQATEAGKVTELREIKELAPKHARSMIKTPAGT